MKKWLLDFWYGKILGSIWQAKRQIVLYRFKGKCSYCSEKLTPKTFTIDHVVPLSAGGTDAFKNLVACCKYCNKLKADKPFNKEMHDRMWAAAFRRTMNRPQ